MRVMAVDPGTARVGLAVSDETETLATPFRVLTGGTGVESRIAQAASGAGAARIIVGLPVRLDGSEGDEARAARSLAQRLEALTGLPVDLWDERFTTEIALRLRRSVRKAAAGGRKSSGAAGGGRKARAAGRRRPDADDAAAAAVLLQSYLDRGPAAR
jgi:putative Holliday junction resolvase